jgi:hypothetical protein
MKVADGRTVTYTRGAASMTFTAWPGAALFSRTTEEPGPSVVRSEADYLFAVADWTQAAVGGLPQTGDRITDPTVTDPAIGSAVVFELQPPTKGEPVMRYSDALRTVFRVHLKRVKSS